MTNDDKRNDALFTQLLEIDDPETYYPDALLAIWRRLDRIEQKVDGLAADIEFFGDDAL